jgi:protein-disulfide isomerase
MAGVACVAQSSSSELSRKIEHQMRTAYNVPQDVKLTIGAITPSNDLPGYSTVPVSFDGSEGKSKDVTFLISADHNTLLRVTKFDLTKDPYVTQMSKIDLKGRPTRGAEAAKVVVVNFDDFECPYCAAMHRTLFPELLKEYGDRVTFVYKDYPLSEIHPWATHAAIDANCLASLDGNAYWDFADYIHANKSEVDSQKTDKERFDVIDKVALLQGQKHSLDIAHLRTCLNSQNADVVNASIKEASGIGVSATPTVFINGQKIDGAVGLGQLRATLDNALKEAGEPVPDHSLATAPSLTPTTKSSQ